MLVLSGKTGNAGFALGPVEIWNPAPDFEKREVADPQGERTRLDAAISSATARMKASAKGADDEAARILEAQAMMLEDPSLQTVIRSIIESESVNAEFACIEAGRMKAKGLEASDSPYLRARAADIRDATRKLAFALAGGGERAFPKKPSIIFADEISPQDVSSAPEGIALAFVTETGSPMSHAAILCGNRGIPFVYGIKRPDFDFQGAECAVDAERGEFIVEPDQMERARIIEHAEALKRQDAEAPAADLPIRICANIGSPQDALAALDAGADGVGLYRTEFLYMNRDEAPDEDEQFEAYRSVLEAMGDREVIVRTMDIGADKPAACLHMPQEPNPALGHRALRICLDDPDLFRVQLRALLRASRFGNLAIMLPMVASVQEIDDAAEQLRIAQSELRERGIECELPPLGIMVETPAAAVLSDQMAKKADFFSIGTNDLAQYTLAVDRQGENLERYFKADHESIMRLIDLTVRNAHAAGIPVGVCGELGGNPAVLPKLMELGVDELSMAPAKIGRAKKLIASIAEKQGGQGKANEPGSEKRNGGTAVDQEGERPCGIDGSRLHGAILSPVDGEVIPMEEIPDPAFSRGTLGKCIGVLPSSGIIHAPCKGTVTMVASTLHAFSIRANTGDEVLVHVGIDTVSLGGEGFDCLVKPGDRVEADQPVMHVDLDKIRAAGLSTIVVVALLE